MRSWSRGERLTRCVVDRDGRQAGTERVRRCLADGVDGSQLWGVGAGCRGVERRQLSQAAEQRVLRRAVASVAGGVRVREILARPGTDAAVVDAETNAELVGRCSAVYAARIMIVVSDERRQRIITRARARVCRRYWHTWLQVLIRHLLIFDTLRVNNGHELFKRKPTYLFKAE